ncbi:MAG: hypothetical protein CMK09_11245 [Ponticaulis sp.]|nr:hypothetical protein [Ponticaulis sp.]|tara:strand:+ start:4196 stop:4396 length:201 start_codon:yes stop_codon:yes gene_type:complete
MITSNGTGKASLSALLTRFKGAMRTSVAPLIRLFSPENDQVYDEKLPLGACVYHSARENFAVGSAC